MRNDDENMTSMLYTILGVTLGIFVILIAIEIYQHYEMYFPPWHQKVRELQSCYSRDNLNIVFVQLI